MSPIRRLHHTYADYLAVERESPVRHKYRDGEISALAEWKLELTPIEVFSALTGL